MNRLAPTATLALATFLSGGCALPGGFALPGGPAAAPTETPTMPAPAVAAPAMTPHARAAAPVAPAAAVHPAHAAAGVQQAAAWGPMHGGPMHPGGPAYGHAAHATHAPAVAHAPQAPCTAGCCGTAGPVYPTMPPMAAFGLDPQEFLCDGGDAAPSAAVNLDDRMIGIGLEDTVVKYETADGSLHLEPSNRVCIYAPRFASVRKVTGALTDEKTVTAVGHNLPRGPVGIDRNQPSSAVMAPLQPLGQDVVRGPDAFRARDRGVPIENVDMLLLAEDVLPVLVDLSIISDGTLRDAEKPWLAKGAAAAIAWSLDEAVGVTVNEVRAAVVNRDVSVAGLTVYDLPGGRLRVCKLADRNSAQVGDVVTFVLRVDNTGEGKLDNVVLTDNLTTRLEYIEDSQTCSKGAIFETEENEGGSLRLTWTFTDDFQVGEAAIIRFRCRVR